MASKKKLKRLLFAAEERAHQLDTRLIKLGVEMRQWHDRIQYCPACGKDVTRQLVNVTFMSDPTPKHIQGRWECLTKGCTYGPPADARGEPTDG